MECTFCGSDLADYDAVLLDRETGGNQPEGRERVGAFCNYGCLSAWLDESDAVVGSCCRLDLDDASR